jgi:hypothetical protein
MKHSLLGMTITSNYYRKKSDWVFIDEAFLARNDHYFQQFAIRDTLLEDLRHANRPVKLSASTILLL